MELYSNFFVPSPLLVSEASTINYKPCPSWLGQFQIKMYGEAYGRNHGKLPPALRALALDLTKLVPEQQFTTCFVQKYKQGSFVSPHRDPKNNIGYTLIALFGSWIGGKTIVENVEYETAPGTVCKLPCTFNGYQGPRHSVTEITSGIRYALILNTIE